MGTIETNIRINTEANVSGLQQLSGGAQNAADALNGLNNAQDKINEQKSRSITGAPSSERADAAVGGNANAPTRSDQDADRRTEKQTNDIKEILNSAMANRLTNLGFTPEAARDKADSFRNSSSDEQTKATKELLRMEEMKRRNDQTSDSPGNPKRRGGRRATLARRAIGAGRAINGVISGSAHDIVGTAAGLGQQGGTGLSSVGEEGSDLNKNLGLLGGALAVAATALLLGNEISKQYEKQVPALIETTANLGLFGKTAREQSDSFRNTMSLVSGISANYGYTLEQGEGVISSLIKGGGSRGNAMSSMGSLEAASRSIGLASPSEAFIQLTALGQQFNGKSLDYQYALGSALYNKDKNGNVMGSGRAEEQASALASMEESGMSQGINLSDPERSRIAGTQNWLYSQLGPRAAGQGGAQLYSQLSGAVRGSTALGSETDILKYQAAHKDGESYIDTMKHLEAGFDPKDFDKFKKRISGGSREEQVELTRQAYGTNYTTAEQMLNAGSGKDAGNGLTAATGPGGAIKSTNEVGLIKAQQIIAQDIRVMGTVALDGKASLVGGVAGATSSVVGDDIAKRERATALANEDKYFGKMKSTENGVGQAYNNYVNNGWGKAVSPNSEAASKALANVFDNPKYTKALSNIDSDPDTLKAMQGLAPANGTPMTTAQVETFIKYLDKISTSLDKKTTATVRR